MPTRSEFSHFDEPRGHGAKSAPLPTLQDLLHPYAAAVHLELQVLHRRAREVPRHAGMGGTASDESVGEQRVGVADRIELGRGGVAPADAEQPEPPR